MTGGLRPYDPRRSRRRDPESGYAERLSHQELDTALRALADEDRDRAAPSRIQAYLMGEFRRAHAPRRRRRIAWTAGAAAMAATVVLAVLLFSRPDRPREAGIPDRLSPQSTAPEPGATTARPLAVPPETGFGAVAVAPRVIMPAAPAQEPDAVLPGAAATSLPPATGVPQTGPREVVTEFFPLMDVIPPFQRGRLLRVVVPAATMREVGLPVSPALWGEPVEADVLVGEEGIARAIRFVGYE